MQEKRGTKNSQGSFAQPMFRPDSIKGKKEGGAKGRGVESGGRWEGRERGEIGWKVGYGGREGGRVLGEETHVKTNLIIAYTWFPLEKVSGLMNSSELSNKKKKESGVS